MIDSADPHDLQRFVDPQDDIIDDVKRELRAGRKWSHWMWFVFTQVEGLGSSRTAQRYAIGSREEAEEFTDLLRQMTEEEEVDEELLERFEDRMGPTEVNIN
jgi:uncharacterized protein (DUF1810 family)